MSKQNPVPVPVSVSVDDPCPSGPSSRSGLAHKFTPQPAFSLPKLFARRQPASSSLSSISSRPTVVSLTHPASNCLQLTGAKRTKQRLSRQINIPSTYVDIWRSWHPPKPSRPATPSQTGLLYSVKDGSRIEHYLPPAALLNW